MVAAVFYPGYLGGLCFFTGCVVKAILVSWCMYSDKEAMIWVKLKLKILSNRVLRKRGHFRCESQSTPLCTLYSSGAGERQRELLIIPTFGISSVNAIIYA